MKGVLQRRNIQDKDPQSMLVAAQVIGQGKWPADSPQRNIPYCVMTNIIRATQIAALGRHGRIPVCPEKLKSLAKGSAMCQKLLGNHPVAPLEGILK